MFLDANNDWKDASRPPSRRTRILQESPAKKGFSYVVCRHRLGRGHYDTVVIDEAGRKAAQLRVKHTAEGLTKLIHFLREIAQLDQIAYLIETTHGLLITAEFLAGVALYPVNPKTSDRKHVASGARTNLIDAYLLAKHGRCEVADLRRLDPDSPKIV